MMRLALADKNVAHFIAFDIIDNYICTFYSMLHMQWLCYGMAQ